MEDLKKQNQLANELFIFKQIHMKIVQNVLKAGIDYVSLKEQIYDAQNMD